MLIDTHCHIFNEYYDDITNIIERMQDGIMIVSGDNKESNLEVIELCSRYDNIYGTIGYHPEIAVSITKEDLQILENQLSNPKIVGLGEIGLDYHYGKENIDKQKDVFKQQLLLANQYHKTVVVHSRDAAEDTYELLKEYLGNNHCIMHCYSYSVDMAKKFLPLGIKFGVGGTLTFKNNKKTVEVVKNLGLENFVLETDSPYLSPEPHRGKLNQPFYVHYVAEKIAEIKNISYEKVVEVTSRTAISEFDLPI